ncbi:hypothetical protein FRB90_002187 [Tulasnella sp. 427]|nr:hypothetical protein FRB90_002187 [Tulasnella sp. 427]
MADNRHPGPLPPKEPGVHPSQTHPARMASRFARRDPQLLPLAVAVVGILGVGAWFGLYKKTSELNHPGAVGGLPHSPELSKARMDEWKSKPSAPGMLPEKDKEVNVPAKR